MRIYPPSSAVRIVIGLSLYGTLQAQYCIQVQTYNLFDTRAIDAKTEAVLHTYETARIEKRGSHYTLRVGDFPSYRDALGTLEQIHQSHRDAFVRKCDLDPSSVVYPATATPVTPQTPSEALQPHLNLPTPPVKTAPKAATTERSLWEECQKCFAPLYIEEQEEAEPVTKPLRTEPPVRSAFRSSAPAVNDNDAFWSEVIRQRSSASASVSSQKTEYPSLDYYYPSQSR